MENDVVNNENSKKKKTKNFLIVIFMILAIGIGTFIFLNNNKWDFELDKQEELGDLYYSVSSKWRTWETERDNGYTKYYYPFEKNEDGVIMIDITQNCFEGFRPEEYEKTKIDSNILSGFKNGLGKNIDSSEIKNVNNNDMGYVKYNDETMQYITYFWLNHNILNTITIAGNTKSYEFEKIIDDMIRECKIKDFTFDNSFQKIKVGESVKVNVKFNPSSYNDSLKWTSSDESIATVVDGTINGIKNGDVVITATASNGLTNVVKVTVFTPVKVPDFSGMSSNEAKEWGKNNNITINVTTEYSDSIENGKLISQSKTIGEEITYTGTTINLVYSIGRKPTIGETNALKKAQSYSTNMHMSKKRLYDQLTSSYGEGFTASEAQYAVDHVEADWNYNALQKAKSYQKDMNMSKSRIYQQLTSNYGEGFTASEAQYAIDNLEE